MTLVHMRRLVKPLGLSMLHLTLLHLCFVGHHVPQPEILYAMHGGDCIIPPLRGCRWLRMAAKTQKPEDACRSQAELRLIVLTDSGHKLSWVLLEMGVGVTPSYTGPTA